MFLSLLLVMVAMFALFVLWLLADGEVSSFCMKSIAHFANNMDWWAASCLTWGGCTWRVALCVFYLVSWSGRFVIIGTNRGRKWPSRPVTFNKWLACTTPYAVAPAICNVGHVFVLGYVARCCCDKTTFCMKSIAGIAANSDWQGASCLMWGGLHLAGCALRFLFGCMVCTI